MVLKALWLLGKGIARQMRWTVLTSFLTCLRGRFVWNVIHRELGSLKINSCVACQGLKFLFPSFLVNIGTLWRFLNISHWNDYIKRLITIHFFINFKVRNVFFLHISPEMREQIPVLAKGHNRLFLSTKIAITNWHNTFKNHLSLVRNVTDRYWENLMSQCLYSNASLRALSKINLAKQRPRLYVIRYTVLCREWSKDAIFSC